MGAARLGLELKQATAPRWWQRRSVRRTVGLAVVYVVLIGFAIIVALPFYWLVNTSLKSQDAMFVYPPGWFPSPVELGNYSAVITGHTLRPRVNEPTTVVEGYTFLLYLRNTVLITAINLVGRVLSSALVAYALARIRFKGRDVIFSVVMVIMMLPGVMTLVPLYVTFARLRWLNTFLPLTVPGFFGDAFLIFLLRQFFRTIPPELEDAARVDGCGLLRLLAQVIFPLSKSALATAAIFVFMYEWNDFLHPLLYLQKNELKTLQLGMLQFTDRFKPMWGIEMAYSTVVILPCLLLFFFVQRIFIQGVVITGIEK